MTAGEGWPDLEGVPAAGWRDDVLRRRAFEAANPGLEITTDEGGNWWTATGFLANRTAARASARTLGRLLDKLGAP